MKLSIIIPVYKVEQYILQCLSSIYASNVDEEMFEVIIVNDGTPDNSMHIVETFASKYKNLQIINQENGGLSRARNAGIYKAIGEYLWFIDSDDWVSDDALERVITMLQAYDNIELFASGLKWVWGDADVRKIDITLDADNLISSRTYVDYGYPRGAIQRFIVKRQIIIENKIEFYPDIYHEDGLFGNQLLYLVKNVYVFSVPFYYYRQREESIMHSLTIKNSYDMITVHRELMKFADTFCSDTDKKWFKNKVFDCAFGSLLLTWHLRHTLEFKKFYKKNLSYIRQQALILLWQPRITRNLGLLLTVISPLLYVRIIARLRSDKNR